MKGGRHKIQWVHFIQERKEEDTKYSEYISYRNERRETQNVLTTLDVKGKSRNWRASNGIAIEGWLSVHCEEDVWDRDNSHKIESNRISANVKSNFVHWNRTELGVKGRRYRG